MRLSVRSNTRSLIAPAISTADVLRWTLLSAATFALIAGARTARAQGLGTSASITPYAGYLVTGKMYDGPLGTSLKTTDSPLVGGQIGVPLTRGVALTGSLAYSSGDLQVGLPIFGGVDVGTHKMWMYDAALELGGLSGRRKGIAPFITGGVGGVTNDIKNALFSTHATNLAWTAGVGADMGLSRSFALRFQAKDYIGRFDTEEAVGFRAKGNLAHNWAFSAGVKLAF